MHEPWPRQQRENTGQADGVPYLFLALNESDLRAICRNRML